MYMYMHNYDVHVSVRVCVLYFCTIFIIITNIILIIICACTYFCIICWSFIIVASWNDIMIPTRIIRCTHVHILYCMLHITMFTIVASFIIIIIGGTIEGHAPSDNVTSLTAEIYLKPNKTHTLLSTWDHILSEPFKVWGGSMPQTSVDYDDLTLMVDRIAKAAFSRGLVGHISVDFVTFIDPETVSKITASTILLLKTLLKLVLIKYTILKSHFSLQMSQVTWAVDLDFGPSDMIYMSNLASGMAGLTMPEWSTGQRVESTPQYYMVASTRLKHVNLSVVQYSVFFQMCKAHLIGFNNKVKKENVF